MQKTTAWILVAWLFFTSLLTGGERIYRGKWDGSPIEVRLKINDRTGVVTGQAYNPGAPSEVLAVLTGWSFADGSLELRLTYRFEDYGIYHLSPGEGRATKIWQTSGKDLWFGLSD